MTRIAKWLLVVILLVGSALAVELTAPDGGQGDEFGSSLSVSGNTLAIISVQSGISGNGGGNVYVFQKGANNSWGYPVLVAELTASDGSKFFSVAISGNTIVAGAPATTVNGGHYQGCAFVFVASAQGWQNANETARLTASDGAMNNYFGRSVAINAKTIVVGAPGVNNNGTWKGEAYEFTQPQTGWATATETARLTASDGLVDDQFGTSVSVNGVTAAVGAIGTGVLRTGSIYVFRETLGGWQSMTETAELTEVSSFWDEALGSSVVIQGGTVVGGAPNGWDDPTGWHPRVLIYIKPVDGWQSTNIPNAVLTSAGDNGSCCGFGTSLAINPNLIVAGNPQAINYGRHNIKYSGAVFTFKKPPLGWVDATQSTRLLLKGGAAVGYSVAASFNKVAFIGALATLINQNQSQGAAFVVPVK